MSGHIDTERMHDLVDGLLSAGDAVAARDHLDACAHCRDELRRLEEVVVALRALPQKAKAPEGVWAAVEERIASAPDERIGRGADVRERGVLPLHGARRRRRFSFTVPQLAAAAVVVSLLSAGTVWTVLSVGTADRSVASAFGGSGSAARMAASGGLGYGAAVAELQQLVDTGRDLMAPETAEALDRSLRTIDEAMAEIRRALEQDPESELLARLLVNQQGAKLRVLRQAATVVQARS